MPNLNQKGRSFVLPFSEDMKSLFSSVIELGIGVTSGLTSEALDEEVLQQASPSPQSPSPQSPPSPPLPHVPSPQSPLPQLPPSSPHVPQQSSSPSPSPKSPSLVDNFPGDGKAGSRSTASVSTLSRNCPGNGSPLRKCLPVSKMLTRTILPKYRFSIGMRTWS